MTENEFNHALEKVQNIIKSLETQDKESGCFFPKLDFSTLYPEAVKNMLENGHMIRDETCEKEYEAILNCKSTPEERMRNYKNTIGED